MTIASFYIQVLSVSTNGTWQFIDGGAQTAITGLFTMNSSIFENRVKYIPQANVSGDGISFLSIRVVDAYGASEPVSILLPLCKYIIFYKLT